MSPDLPLRSKGEKVKERKCMERILTYGFVSHSSWCLAVGCLSQSVKSRPALSPESSPVRWSPAHLRTLQGQTESGRECRGRVMQASRTAQAWWKMIARFPCISTNQLFQREIGSLLWGGRVRPADQGLSKIHLRKHGSSCSSYLGMNGMWCIHIMCTQTQTHTHTHTASLGTQQQKIHL